MKFGCSPIKHYRYILACMISLEFRLSADQASATCRISEKAMASPRSEKLLVSAALTCMQSEEKQGEVACCSPPNLQLRARQASHYAQLAGLKGMRSAALRLLVACETCKQQNTALLTSFMEHL